MQYVKTDNCHRPGQYTEQELYANFSRALNATGRPILFSLCEWGDSDVESWGGTVGQMFRIQQDHLPFWNFPAWAAGAGFGQGTANIIEYVATLKISSYKQQASCGCDVWCAVGCDCDCGCIPHLDERVKCLSNVVLCDLLMITTSTRTGTLTS